MKGCIKGGIDCLYDSLFEENASNFKETVNLNALLKGSCLMHVLLQCKSKK